MRVFGLLFTVLILSLGVACGDVFWGQQVAEATVAVPLSPAVQIRSADKFLNDLKLSPYWKVEKDRRGAYQATARSVAPLDDFEKKGRAFVFELMARENPKLGEHQILDNSWLRGANYTDGRSFNKGREPFSSFLIRILFRKPTDPRTSFVTRGRTGPLRVYDSPGQLLGPNSSSLLAVKLSATDEAYLVLQEQGSDQTRSSTVQELAAVLREVHRIAELPDRYRVADVYGSFLGMLFKPPLLDQALGRFPGIQDRDSFYGCFRAKPGISYEGLNIKVSHPVYCPEEGTRKYSRLEKAEYVGKPYYEGDVMFFLIEDNAVYLPGEYNKQFGTFSGTSSFEGTLEILNDQGTVLLKTTEKFKGWER